MLRDEKVHCGGAAGLKMIWDMSYAPYLSDERLTASRIIPWSGEGEGKSAIGQAAGLLTAGKWERKGIYLKEVVVGRPRQWQGERGWGRGGGGDQVRT
jgi:hypothetical protein